MKFKWKCNSLYFFRYKSKLADQKKIPVYDQAPLVILLDCSYYPKKGKILGINFHWIPRKYRKTFLDILQELFKMQREQFNKRTPRLFYNTVKYNMTLRAIAIMAIRVYFINRITNLTEIPEEFWDDVLGIKRFRSRFAYRRRNYKH